MSEAVDAALDAVLAEVAGEDRPGQRRMAAEIAGAFEAGNHLLVQAGTGTGKSLGYLVPAALFAQSQRQPVVIATATRALQRQLMERDLPAVAKALAPILDRPLRYAVLKGRSNYVCLQRLHGGGATDDEQLAFVPTTGGALTEQAAMVRAWAEATQTGDRDDYPNPIDPKVWSAFSVSGRECVGESRCAFGEECFTALQRHHVMEADIIVTNHALLAIEALESIPVLPEYGALIVDEGHELVDRATTALSIALSGPQCDRSIAAARRFLSDEVVADLHDAADAVQVALQDCSGEIRELPSALREALHLLEGATREGITNLGSKPDEDDVASHQRAKSGLEETQMACRTLLASSAKDVVWVDDNGRLHLAPLSIAEDLRDQLFSRSPVVITSATLTVGGGFDVLAQTLGLTDETFTALDVGTPFDHAKQGILYVAGHLPPPNRDGIPMEGLDELAALIEAAGGRTLALFSSWAGVDRAEDFLRVRLSSEFPVLVQRRGDATGPLLERFASEPRTTLLGTIALWQGVDVPGESCICVVIDRIPFPRPDDPLLAARQRVVDAAGGSGFRSVAIPRAALLLAQGTGRLIRGPADRGVVAVLDSRLANAGYAGLLRSSLPPFWFTTRTDEVLAALKRLDEELPTAGAGR
jgi:ATP-dependent DNA helicase DinG